VDFHELRQDFNPADSMTINGLGRNVNAGLKPLAQYMEALRAGATSTVVNGLCHGLTDENGRVARKNEKRSRM